MLDIGSGSGYLCAVMGLMVGDKGGHVYGVDHIPGRCRRPFPRVHLALSSDRMERPCRAGGNVHLLD